MNSISSSIRLPLMGGLGLLLFFALFIGAIDSGGGEQLSTAAGNPLPVFEPAFVHASNEATVAPIRDWSVEDPAISARTALVLDDISGMARPLYIRNIKQRWPLASIIKLLTALTALSVLDPVDTVSITADDIAAPENAGGLRVGENISVRHLLAALLVESSNDAAHALARVAGEGSVDAFVDQMNLKARALGLYNLTAADPMGIDPATTGTAMDVARLLHIALGHPVIGPLLAQDRFTTERHTFESTHNLIQTLGGVTGAKTGFTDEAGQNLVLQRKLSNGRFITSVVLGSTDRETDTTALHHWTEETFNYTQ